MEIGIVGKGAVGDAVHQGLSSIGHNLCHYDIKDSETSIQNILETELVFLCVPTDSTESGNCDTSIVESIIAQLYTLDYSGVIAIKSTVIPGTTDRMSETYSSLKICCVPEFLRQKSAYSDFADEHDVLVIGTKDSSIASMVEKAHGILPHKVVVVSEIEAEVVKYFNNVHNAMEIVFANAMHEMCTKLNANYQNVLGAIRHRQNINPNYLRCSNTYRGYGGHCLPKDSLAWKNLAEKLNVDVKIFKDIVEDNRRYTE